MFFRRLRRPGLIGVIRDKITHCHFGSGLRGDRNRRCFRQRVLAMIATRACALSGLCCDAIHSRHSPGIRRARIRHGADFTRISCGRRGLAGGVTGADFCTAIRNNW
jgi:hypothetical protein